MCVGADLDWDPGCAAWVPTKEFQELYVQMNSAYDRHKTMSEESKQAKADETMKRQERAKLAVTFVGDRVRGKRCRDGSPEGTPSAAEASPTGSVCQQDSTGSGTSSSCSGGSGKKLAKRTVGDAIDNLGSVTAFLQQSVQDMHTAAAGCHAPAAAPPPPAVQPLASATLRAELAELTLMKEEGLLSEDEYQMARAGAIAGRR